MSEAKCSDDIVLMAFVKYLVNVCFPTYITHPVPCNDHP